VGVIQKQSTAGVIWSYIGVGLGFIITVFLFVEILTTAEIGLLRVLVSYASILGMIASLGMNAVTIKMFPLFRDEQLKHQGYLGVALLVIIAGFTVTSLAYLLFRDYFITSAEEKSALFIPFYYTVIPLSLFIILFGILDSYYRMLFNAVKGIASKEVFQRVIIIFGLMLYFLEWVDFYGMVWLYVAAYGVPVLHMMFSLIREKKFFIKPNKSFFTPEIRKEIFNVGLFGILASFSARLVQYIDVIMINEYLGLSDTGIYTVSFYFGTLILIPMRTMQKIGSTVVSEAWKDNNLKTISDVYTKSSLTLSVLGMLFLIGIWGNIDNVFHLLGKDYSTGKYVILFISLANLTDVFMGISNAIIVNSKYYRWQTYQLLSFTLVLIGTNVLLIPDYGIVGAAIASLISKLFLNIFKYLFIYFRFGLQPFNLNHLLLVVIGAGAWWVSTLIPAVSNYIIDIIIRSFVISVLFLVPVYYLNISSDISHRADVILKRFGIRLR
jgi:O-antigen/teichoic acid export membrane protein